MLVNQKTIQIDADFPGGNILVEAIADNTVHLRQELRDTDGWWFYWAFCVRGAQGRTLRFLFTDGEPVGVRGPAVSTDGGINWHWLGSQGGDTRSFRYHFAEDADCVYFSFGIPYRQLEWEGFLDRHCHHPQVESGVLCTSRHGRPVEYLLVTPRKNESQFRVCLTARHHSCEAMANYAMDGLLDTVLAGTTPQAQWLAEHVAWMAVPFVDKDGVEEGDQGKNRRPHDHARDYLGDSIYPENSALRALLPGWLNGQMSAVIDLHCPWIRGEHNEDIYQVGLSQPHAWAAQQRFGAILEQACRVGLPYRTESDLPFSDASWNNADNFRTGQPLCHWVANTMDLALTTSFEIPYANAGGVPVTPDSTLAFGANLAQALYTYFHTLI